MVGAALSVGMTVLPLGRLVARDRREEGQMYQVLEQWHEVVRDLFSGR